MKIVHSKILPPRGYKAITLFNVIVVRNGTLLSPSDLNHEDIHWQQEKELLIVGFYILYVLMLVFRLAQYAITGYRLELHGFDKLSLWKTAYRRIPFEREAYCNQSLGDYIESRQHYCWTKYL